MLSSTGSRTKRKPSRGTPALYQDRIVEILGEARRQRVMIRSIHPDGRERLTAVKMANLLPAKPWAGPAHRRHARRLRLGAQCAEPDSDRPTGAGKTWLACAFGQQACRQGFPVFYVRVARLFEELKIAHGDGSFTRRLAQLAKNDVLILDDWGLQDLDQAARNDLLEVLDDRVGTRPTVITSQLPLEHWHAWLQDPTLADAILDRLVHQAHKLLVKGDSMRKKAKSETADA